MKHVRPLVLVPLVMMLVLAPGAASAGEPPGSVTVSPAEGFIPIAIWELRREGFPMVRHAWVAGSEKMLRVSWDDGITWFGFRPVYADAARGMLALKVAKREELGRGEVAWQDKAGLTISLGVPGRTAFAATVAVPAFEVTLTLVEVKEISPEELKPKPIATQSLSTERGAQPKLQNAGGPDSCCLSCEGMRVCDCSVCIPSCQLSCCASGCLCQGC